MLYIDQHDDNGVSVVALRGQAGVPESPALTEVIILLAAARPEKLLFDLSNLTFISSLSLGELASLAAALGKFKSRLALAGVSPQIRSALHRARLDRQYEVFDTVAAAVAALGARPAELAGIGRDAHAVGANPA
jgi:anti-anti-sigma factor